MEEEKEIKEYHTYFEMLPIPDIKDLKFELLSDSGSKFIKPLSKVNIFIGENNSGKSILQREMLKQNYQIGKYNQRTFKLIIENIQQMQNELFVEFQKISSDYGLKFTNNPSALSIQLFDYKELIIDITSCIDENERNYETIVFQYYDKVNQIWEKYMEMRKDTTNLYKR